MVSLRSDRSTLRNFAFLTPAIIAKHISILDVSSVVSKIGRFASRQSLNDYRLIA